METDTFCIDDTCMITTENPLLNKSELRYALGLPSTRSIDQLVRKRKIPFIRLGHRTLRFNLADVEAALKKLTIKEVGR